MSCLRCFKGSVLLLSLFSPSFAAEPEVDAVFGERKKAPPFFSLTIVSDHKRGMDLLIDGKKMGKTPFRVDLPPGKEVMAEVKSEKMWGYKKITAGPAGEEDTVVIPAARDFYSVVYIKGGTFAMGSRASPDEKPVHLVSIDGFFMGVREVTDDEFRQFINETRYRTDARRLGSCWVFENGLTKKPGVWWENLPRRSGLNPVTCVSWNDAAEFARWLSGRTGKLFGLPFEAEWEYAATREERKGSSNGRSTVTDSGRQLNYCDQNCEAPWAGEGDDGFADLAPAGSYPPDRQGLYDLRGNVWEWCRDWYWEEYYSHSPLKNPQGPLSDNLKVVRGGSWLYPLKESGSRNRSYFRRDFRSTDLGFRLVVRP